MSLVFDSNYETKKDILDDLSDECNFSKIVSKHPSDLNIYFIGTSDTEGTVKHKFGDDRFSCTLSEQEWRCKTCDRLKVIGEETMGGVQPEIVLLVDPDYAKWIGKCKPWQSNIEQVDFNEDLDLYKDYFQYYSKLSKKEGKPYHIILWWPSEAANFNLTSDARGDINYGEKVQFSFETGSSTPVDVQWKRIDESGMETPLGQSTAQKNMPSRITESIRGSMRICATVPSCGAIPYCLSIKPNEKCESINMEVGIQTDDEALIKKYKLPKKLTEGKTYPEWEINQKKGSYTFYFKIPRQCGVSSYKLYVRRFGDQEYSEFNLEAGVQISDNKNFELWTVKYKEIEEGGFLESAEFENAVCEVYIEPFEFDTSLKVIPAKKNRKLLKVLFQKCA
jgi:hypothetical protein